MATEMKDYEVPPRYVRSSAVKEEWMNGSWWKLERGKDFTSLVKSMQSQVNRYANQRGGRMQTHIADEDTLMIRRII